MLQFPPTLCVREVPAAKVVPLPIVTSPPIVIPAAIPVVLAVPESVKLLLIVVTLAIFFAPEPERVRLLYATAFTV